MFLLSSASPAVEHWGTCLPSPPTLCMHTNLETVLPVTHKILV